MTFLAYAFLPLYNKKKTKKQVISLLNLLLKKNGISIFTFSFKSYNMAIFRLVSRISGKKSFNEILLRVYKIIHFFFAANSENNIYESLYVAMRLSLSSGDLTNMMKKMDSFFAGISYAMYSNEEKLYHMVFFIILKLMGAKTDGEVCTSDGRVDAVAEKNGFVYLFEFKIDKTEEIAIKQIKNKQYFKPYLNCEKKIIAVWQAGSRKQ